MISFQGISAGVQNQSAGQSLSRRPLQPLGQDTVYFGGNKKSAGATARVALFTALLSVLGFTGIGMMTAKNDLDNRIAGVHQVDERTHHSLDSISSEIDSLDLTKVIDEVAWSGVEVMGQYGLGSGTWVRGDDGRLYVLTNHHVVDGNSLKVPKGVPPTFDIRMYNGSEIDEPVMLKGQIVVLPDGSYAMTEANDMALIEITTPNFKLPDNIKVIELRDIEKEPLRVGEVVIAVGTPHGFTDHVTTGTITHIERNLKNFEPANIFIGSEAAINPGNSGGALYDAQGRFIGVNTAGIPGADGTGLAIRTDIIKDYLIQWGVREAPPEAEAADAEAESVAETPAADESSDST